MGSSKGSAMAGARRSPRHGVSVIAMSEAWRRGRGTLAAGGVRVRVREVPVRVHRAGGVNKKEVTAEFFSGPNDLQWGEYPEENWGPRPVCASPARGNSCNALHVTESICLRGEVLDVTFPGE